ncbi:MAG: xylulokinase [Rhodospirillales bacterium]|nr:xylulokinase [Rhodospirillales bacterium]
MSAQTYLGIDIGTSAVKAVLVDDEQRVVTEAERPLATARPLPSWSEQDPEEWWRAVQTVVAEIKKKAPKPFAAVRGIGLSGQMHGAVLLDGNDRVLRPAILWNDGRAHEECAVIEDRVPDLGSIAGVVAMPGFTAPKVLWVTRNEPDIAAKMRRILLPKDYVRLKLTGEHATDMSDAAGSLWLDENKREWSEPIVTASGVTMDHMPRLVEGSAPCGQLRHEIVDAWGLSAPVTVAGGGGDAAAGAVGIGAIDDGDGFISIGTSGQYFVTTDSYRPKPETLLHSYCMALPERWFQMAAMLNGASALAWAANLIREADIDALLTRVEANYVEPSRVFFLPYLTGERTPHNDPNARGVFFNLGAEHGSVDLIQAVLEGIAFTFVDAQDCLGGAGTSVNRIAAIGGGTRNRFWMRMFASILRRPILLYRDGERGPAFGAARLARLAVTGERPVEVCVKPPVEAAIEPDMALHQAYQPSIARFRRLYAALRSEFPSPD